MLPKPPRLSAPHQHLNPIPPRQQWNENQGYCGETSMICAGLYYGQWLSQYTVRAIAIDNEAQNGGANNQLLLGVNDVQTATQLRLAHDAWDSHAGIGSQRFLTWVKGHVAQGHPVIIGIYNNENTLYGTKKPTAGDPEYDHIVPVVGFGSKRHLDDGAFHRSDIILFSDNGLYTPDNKQPYYFHYPLDTFLAGRKKANKPGGNTYSLANKTKVYGIAITGVIDPHHETLPVRVTTPQHQETPQIGHHSTVRPDPMPMKLTVTVSGLKPNTPYTLYRYDHWKKVPTQNFNQHAQNAVKSWPIQIKSGSTCVKKLTIQSDEIAIFRAVPGQGGQHPHVDPEESP